MSSDARMLWTEGLFLSPQSFQQQERFLFNYIESRSKPISPYYWGIVSLNILAEKLDNGVFSLKNCQGIFPDGTPFDIANSTALEIHLEEDVADHFIYLAIGNSYESSPQVILEKERDEKSVVRYFIDDLDVMDTQTIGRVNKKEKLPIGKLNFQLFVAKQPIDNYTQIAIARIKERDVTGKVNLDQAFIPPTLCSHASTVIYDYICQTSSQLIHRSETLAKRLINPGTSGVSDIIDFNMLLIINRFTTVFRYFSQEKKVHPREVYMEALKLVGELSTIASEEKRPSEYAVYTHNNLALTFDFLFQDIYEYLHYSTVPKALSIPLRVHGQYQTVYTTEYLSESVFTEHNRYVLAVKGDLGLAELQTKIRKISTLASSIDLLHQLVSSHTQGIPLLAQPSVPREIPYHSNCVYFDLDTSSTHWKKVTKSRCITAHVDSLISGLEFEIWAIRGK